MPSSQVQHAVRADAMHLALLKEGAVIIAVDLAGQPVSVACPIGTTEDLAETVSMVEALDRRIVALKVKRS